MTLADVPKEFKGEGVSPKFPTLKLSAGDIVADESWGSAAYSTFSFPLSACRGGNELPKYLSDVTLVYHCHVS